MTVTTRLIDRLLSSEEPSIRYKTRVHVLQEPVTDRRVRSLQEEIRTSSRVRRLLSGRDAKGRLRDGVYGKCAGSALGAGDARRHRIPAWRQNAVPLRDQLMEVWLNKRSFYDEFQTDTKAGS